MTEVEKSLWRKTMNKAQDFVNDPNTKRFAKAGGAMLDVASRLGQAQLKGPIGIAGAAFGVLDVFSNHATLPTYKAIVGISQKRGMKSISANGAVALLHEQGAFADGEVLHSNEDHSVVEAEVDGYKIIVIVDSSGNIQPWWGAYADAGFAVGSLSNHLWASYGNAITMGIQKEENGERLTVSAIKDFSRNEYVGPNEPKEFVATFHKYKEKRIDRAYLLYGPPGSGKTTFSFKCAEELGGKILVVTPDLLENEDVPKREILSLVATLKPSVLLFEDVDRVESDGLMLSMMDNMRQESPDTLMLSTANDLDAIIDALKRPGRLGADLEFPAPDREWCEIVIQLYCDKFGCKEDLKHLAEMMQHKLFTHDYIRETIFQHLVEGEEVAKKYITRTIERLGIEEEEELPDE